MAALTATHEAQRKEGRLIAYALTAGAHIYKGALVCITDATGLAVPASDAAGISFVGVAYEEANNTSGGVSVRVEKAGTYRYAKTSAVQADIGKTVFAADDNTVSVAATAHSLAVGTVVAVPDVAHLRVRIDGAVH